MPYIAKTNLDKEAVHDLLLDTYSKYVSWAMGYTIQGVKTLKHPSGRAASSITAQRDADGYVIGIMFEPTDRPDIASILEYGRPRIDLKKHMLRGQDKRVINFRDIPPARPASVAGRGGIRTIRSAIKAGGKKGLLRVNGPLRFYKNIGRVWAQAHEAHSDKFRTMSNKPGTAKWILKPMPAYSAAHILKQRLPSALRNRMGLPRK